MDDDDAERFSGGEPERESEGVGTKGLDIVVQVFVGDEEEVAGEEAGEEEMGG